MLFIIIFIFFNNIELFSKNIKSDFTYLTNSIVANPSNTKIISALGDYYLYKDNKKEAEKYYSKCIEIEPDNSFHYIKLIKFYLKIGRPDLANKISQKATNYFEKNSEVFFLQGDIDYKIGNFNLAISNYNRGLELNNGYKEKYRVFADIAKCYRELGNYNLSKEYFLQSLRIKDDSFTYYELSKLFHEIKDYNQAIWAIKKAYSFCNVENKILKEMINKKMAAIYLDYAMNLNETGKKEEAKKYLNLIINNKELNIQPYLDKATFWIKRM